jgi:hypothetical protein
LRFISFLVAVRIATVLAPEGRSQSDPDLSHLSAADRSSIESVCGYERRNVGPAAYHQCLQKQLDSLSGSRVPDLSGLNAQDRSSIESVCAYERRNVGPAAYHQCLQKQLDSLSGSRLPDLSGLNAQDRSSIESVCGHERRNVGPAAYHQCLGKQLIALGFPGPGLLPDQQRTPPTAEPTPTISQTLASRATPELQKLGYFGGTWAVTGQILFRSFGVPGKFTGGYRNRWSTDGLSLISDWNEQRPTSTESGQITYEYDPELKAYVCHSVDSSGEKETSVGNVEGQTWTWLSSHTTADGNLGGRFTIKQESAGKYTFKFESQSATGEWELALEGSALKKP